MRIKADIHKAFLFVATNFKFTDLKLVNWRPCFDFSLNEKCVGVKGEYNQIGNDQINKNVSVGKNSNIIWKRCNNSKVVLIPIINCLYSIFDFKDFSTYASRLCNTNPLLFPLVRILLWTFSCHSTAAMYNCSAIYHRTKKILLQIQNIFHLSPISMSVILIILSASTQASIYLLNYVPFSCSISLSSQWLPSLAL